ncbi:MAG: hypothetical protein JO034_07405 [Singulisphaera sp.]|nr:hypothetical protein [Singulisphaera sp.]
MKNVRRMGAIGLGLALVIGSGTLRLEAQEPKPSEVSNSTPARRANDPSRRVPRYFDQIGLTPGQRESIYKICATHQQQIDALEKQIAEIRAQMLSECEALLDDTQKQFLEQRRHAAVRARREAELSKPSHESTKVSN